MYELLLELKERLDQIAIVGVGSITDDFRLKKLEEKLKALSGKAPVLAKLYELVVKLKSGEEVIATFMELNSLVEAILCTQGISKPEGEERDTILYEHQGGFNLTFAQLQEVRNVLNGGTNTKWANLKKAYDEGKLFDFRLLEDFLEHIGDNYEYVDYYYTTPNNERKPFSMQVILEQFGKDIVPILLERFDHYSTSEKVNAIKLIYHFGASEYNDYYKKWAENEEADNVIAEALGALGDTVENETFLMTFKTRKKKIQEARIMSLARVLLKKVNRSEKGIVWDEAQLTSSTMKEIRTYCLKDNELFIHVFNKVPFYTEDEFVALLFETMQQMKDAKEFSGATLYRNKAYVFLKEIICLLDQYSSETAVQTVKKLIEFECEDKKLCLEAMMGSHLLGDYLLASKHRQCKEFLAGIGEQYGGYYITDSFAAALMVYSPQKVYDQFVKLAHKSYLKVDTTIIQMIKDAFDRDAQVMMYTRKEPRCYVPYNESFMTLSGNRQAFVPTNEIKWDPRWLKIAQARDSQILMLFFMIKCVKKEEMCEYKQYFISSLMAWKKQMGSNEYSQYMNLSNEKRNKYMDELICLVTGLCITGAKEEAVSCIDYFTSHLQALEETFVANLDRQDLKYIDLLENELEGLMENKRNRIKQFIEVIRNRVSK